MNRLICRLKFIIVRWYPRFFIRSLSSICWYLWRSMRIVVIPLFVGVAVCFRALWVFFCALWINFHFVCLNFASFYHFFHRFNHLIKVRWHSKINKSIHAILSAPMEIAISKVKNSPVNMIFNSICADNNSITITVHFCRIGTNSIGNSIGSDRNCL